MLAERRICSGSKTLNQGDILYICVGQQGNSTYGTGGWYGGGSGCVNSSGGGSAYLGGVQNGITTTGIITGDGKAIITLNN